MLTKTRPTYIQKKGKKEYVVISFDDYQKIKEKLEDYEDLVDLRKAKIAEKGSAAKSLEEVREELNL